MRSGDGVLRVFVVGCPRSGTTLLQAFLGAHPRLVTRPETHFFQLFSDPDAATEFVDSMDRLAADHDGWVEKTPDHIYELDTITALVPQARFVHVVRDGLEVVASLYWASRERPKMWGGRYSLDECLDRWTRAMQATKAWQEHPAHYVVRYEDLATRPAETLPEVCDFLGIGFDDAMISGRADLAPVLGGSLPWHARLAEDVRYDGGRVSVLDPEQRAYVIARLDEAAGDL